MSKVLDSFCRTCMAKVVGQTNQIIASFHIFQTEDFAHKFTQCTNLQVHPDDEYPSSVCEICLASVLSLYDFQIMCRESIDKFSSMLVENKPEPEISYHLGNNSSSEFLNTTVNQIELKCDQYEIPELTVVVDPLLPPTNSQLPEIELEVQAGITDLQAANENQQTDDGATKKIMAKKAKSHEKGSQDEIHCIEDEDKLENSSEEEGKLQIQEPTSSNNRKSKRAKHQNRSSKAGITDLQATNENQQTDDGTTKKFMAKKAKSHDKSLQDEIHCNEGEDKLENSSDEEGFNTDPDSASPDSDKCERPFVCDVEGCSKRFRILYRLQIHQKRHTGIKNYACPNLPAHIKNKHGHRAGVHPDNEIKRTRRFQCSFCDKAFLRVDAKKYHEMTHTGEKPLVCDECGKKFRKSTHLKNHMRTHIKDAPRGYVCRICGRAFFTAHTLKHHEMKHTGEKPYKCDECDLTFRWPKSLTRHQRLHGDRADVQTRRFQCRFCDNDFSTAVGKKYHEMIHTGEKPHVCDECGKKFRQPKSLKTHMRTHIKDAPRGYVCHICGRAYFTSQNLKHHEMKHTGEKPYKCDECDLTFRWSNDLTRHQRLHQRDKQVQEATESDNQANSKDISKDE